MQPVKPSFTVIDPPTPFLLPCACSLPPSHLRRLEGSSLDDSFDSVLNPPQQQQQQQGQPRQGGRHKRAGRSTSLSGLQLSNKVRAAAASARAASLEVLGMRGSTAMQHHLTTGKDRDVSTSEHEGAWWGEGACLLGLSGLPRLEAELPQCRGCRACGIAYTLAIDGPLLCHTLCPDQP